jgi:toxin YoeB
MRRLSFEYTAFEEYQEWLKIDRKIALKISELLKDIVRTPFVGIGKPEPLKGNFKGYWSRRINDEHRLVYKVANDEIIIASCHSHYGSK